LMRTWENKAADLVFFGVAPASVPVLFRAGCRAN
jgi:hypothetical protein